MTDRRESLLNSSPSGFDCLHDCVRLKKKALFTSSLRQHTKSCNDNSVAHVVALEFGKLKGMDCVTFLIDKPYLHYGFFNYVEETREAHKIKLDCLCIDYR